MEEREAGHERSVQEKAFLIFGIFMFLVYLGIGLSVIFIPAILNSYSAYVKFGIGALLIVYAFFRLIRLLRQYR